MNDSSRPVLEARDVSKSVNGPEGRLDILDGVDLRVMPGESFAIVGASGSGKTTLLGLLAGLDTPDRGSISLDGHALEQLDEEARAELRRRLVGFVFQSFHLLPALTAEENVMLPLELEGSSAARSRAREALEAVGLSARRRHYPAQLSGGEQQRVAIARALALKPKIMLFDEPTSSLDPELTGEVLNVMRDLAAEGMTMVVVSHEIGFAATVGQQIIFLDHGKVLFTGAPQEVFKKPRNPRLEQFLDTYLDRGASMLL